MEAGGDIHIDSRPGHGTTITVDLPATDTPIGAAVPASPVDRAESTDRPAHLLVVEDDEEVRTIVARILTRAGYQVVAPATATAALVLCADPDFAVDVLVTDVIMPDIAGPELVTRTRLTRPQPPEGSAGNTGPVWVRLLS